MDVGVITRLHVAGRIIRPTRRLTASLVKDAPARHSTSLKTVPSIGPPARRATRLISLKRVQPTPGQLKLLALLVETSTSYASRGSTVGIIQPTQGLIRSVYALVGSGKFFSALTYRFFC